jgi:hypothetical protein
VAFTSGGALPEWGNQLIACEQWGIDPAGYFGGNKLMWYLRWREMQTIRVAVKTKK